jgi:hypothetical protein
VVVLTFVIVFDVPRVICGGGTGARLVRVQASEQNPVVEKTPRLCTRARSSQGAITCRGSHK